MMMNVEDIKAKWAAFNEQKGYLQRLDPLHPMDFFVGIDDNGNEELALFTTIEPVQLKSSDALEVEKNIRQDGRWATQISSLQSKNRDIFARLCLDLVESSQCAVSEQEGLSCVIRRFIAWQRLFANIHKDLSINALKGIAGELLFAQNAVEHGYAWDFIFRAWQGPDGADRDFVFPDNWFEIKAISTGKDKVTISSLDQLEVNTPGFLVVYRVDESSETDPQAFTMNNLILKIREMLINYPEAERLLDERLVSVGYMMKKAYDDYYFVCKDVAVYKVDSTFPKLTSGLVPYQIVGAKYDLSLAGINGWKVGKEALWN